MRSESVQQLYKVLPFTMLILTIFKIADAVVFSVVRHFVLLIIIL